MNKMMILWHVILAIVGGCLFFWTTMFKGVDIFYLLDFLVIFIILTVISIVQTNGVDQTLLNSLNLLMYKHNY